MGKPKLPGEKKYVPVFDGFRCVRNDCIYRTPSADTDHRVHSCNYMSVTGQSRIADLPKYLQDPAHCPRYRQGERAPVPVKRNFGEKDI